MPSGSSVPKMDFKSSAESILKETHTSVSALRHVVAHPSHPFILIVQACAMLTARYDIFVSELASVRLLWRRGKRKRQCDCVLRVISSCVRSADDRISRRRHLDSDMHLFKQPGGLATNPRC